MSPDMSTITGDIIHSRQFSDASVWLDPLKKLLSAKGSSPETWEIYRGDSFQVVAGPPEALRTALQIKAVIRQVKHLDVRMAIGLGKKEEERGGGGPSPITESTGDVFVRSGLLLDRLKQEKVHLAIESGDPGFDRELNMMLRLALAIFQTWSVNTAEVAGMLLAEPQLHQKEIGRRLGISQSSVSERIHRGALYEILALEAYYRERVQTLD
ncbi:MAG: SatD family protein [Balneolaceae bacterium]